MMMMSEEPERRRKLSAPISSAIAVPSPEEEDSIRRLKGAATSSNSSTDTGPSKEKLSKNEESEEGSLHSPGEPEMMTGATRNDDHDERGVEAEAGGESEDSQSDEVVNYSINPNSLSTPSPSSPAGSLKSNGGGGSGGGCGGANSATRRIFTPEFKQSVLEAFTNDPECIGNQRATARKFGIHRRQVQKWLQHLTGNDNFKDQNSSDEQEQKSRTDKEAEVNYTTNSSPASSSEAQIVSTENSTYSTVRSTRSSMPIVAGKVPLLTQASSALTSPSPCSSLSTQRINLKNMGSLHPSVFSSTSPSMFPGLTHPLLSVPLSLENSRHPPRSSPHSNSFNGSPPNRNGQCAQTMLDLVDELCYLYPSEDFSLLRKAMLNNEVSFTKLSPPLRKYTSSLSHTTSSSPSPSKSSTNDYITQQTLQMIKSQNEYLQLLQSGYANLSNLSPEVGNLTDHNNKYSSWLNVSPFAAAAAAGFNMPGLGKNGIGNTENNRKRNQESSMSHHTFVSPKAPVTTSKSKTVAAVLAASRSSPNSFDKPKRPSQRRKPNNYRQKSSTITSRHSHEDDFIDPTSMLEVVTTKPSAFSNSNNYNFPTSESQGMDLSTTASPGTQGTNNTMTSTAPTIRSKAMNKDYGFLSDLGLVRKERPPTNGHSHPLLSSTASLEHFVQNVLPHRKPSPPIIESSTSRSPPSNETNSSSSSESSDRTKTLVLEAFNFDSELAGDARGVARKFGLNIRVVQKWIREAPTRSIPPSEIQSNGGISLIMDNPIAAVLNSLEEYNGGDEKFRTNSTFHRTIISNNGPTVNKRKNPKPNQIRDFTEDVEGNCPLDMVVPIKKRRVSTPTPTSG